MTANAAVLLVNLGSPVSPAIADVRAYLREFLMDERVLDAPYPLRWLIVHGLILPFRPKKSARAYGSIWGAEGSPLVVISQRVQAALTGRVDMPVELAMRYGQPSISGAVQSLAGRGIQKIILLPMYPHYAMSTYETVQVAVADALKGLAKPPKLVTLPPFYNHRQYLAALAASVQPYRNQFEHLLMSYHGIPERHLRKTDPTGAHCLRSAGCCSSASAAHARCYRHQVLATSQGLAQGLGLPPESWTVAFQSRLGRDAWLQPYTEATLMALAQRGVKRLGVVCPAFTADCLETLEEIGERGREVFLHAGGEQFTLIPCLNDQPHWVAVLAKWMEELNSN
ncbi:MAG: ferrochelatase [Anaerolineales bacterium]